MKQDAGQAAFEQAGLAGVLKYNRLIVQPNQRHYSWEEVHVTKLFKDLSKAISDNENSYFLGTIVTIPHTADETLEVVDGQQRLATTALLLAAIRDFLSGKEPVIVESINNEFLTGIDRIKRERVPRLRLNVDDNDLFGWLMTRNQNTPEPTANKPSLKLLKDAYSLAAQQVKNIVATLDAKDHGDVLNGWVSFLENKAVVVLVRVPSGANAYKMFETLNDRGLKSSQADLIKNYLFGRSGSRISEVQNRWAFMLGQLESMEEGEITVTFLRHTLIVLRGFVTESAVYEAVTDFVRSEQVAVSFSSSLETASSAYAAITNSDSDKWNSYPGSVRRSIEVLNLLDIKPVRPMILAIALRMTGIESAQALQFMVSLSVRLLVTRGTRTGSTEETIAGAAHALFTQKIATLADIKKQLSAIIPSDPVFKLEFETAQVIKAILARYYLRSLEMAAKGEPEPWFFPVNDPSIINLEHVLPKKPGTNWPEFAAEEVEIYANRLGNQVLLRASDNSIVKNDPFANKKPVLAASPYVLTNQIANVGTWNVAAISGRQKRLAELALIAWPI